MSKIIRSANAQQPEDSSIVEIKLQNFFEPIHYGKTEDEQIDELSQQKSRDIEKERQQMLERANDEIEQQKAGFEQYRTEQLAAIEAIKQSWEEEKIILQQEAYDAGFAQGYEDGIQKAHGNMQQSVQAANETMENAQKNAASYIESQESVLLDLALTAAERIIHTTLDRDDELFVSIVRRGLKEAREMKEIKLYVSPKYHPIVTEHQKELAEMFPVNVLFMVFVNEDLLDSESYIETNHGRIVISIDEQLQELRRQLYELIESKE